MKPQAAVYRTFVRNVSESPGFPPDPPADIDQPPSSCSSSYVTVKAERLSHKPDYSTLQIKTDRGQSSRHSFVCLPPLASSSSLLLGLLSFRVFLIAVLRVFNDHIWRFFEVLSSVFLKGHMENWTHHLLWASVFNMSYRRVGFEEPEEPTWKAMTQLQDSSS